MKDISAILVGLFFVAFAIATVIWHYRRSASLLQQWARQHGFRLISQEYCYFFRGPFFWTSSKNQTVYYVRSRTSTGKFERAGSGAAVIFWGFFLTRWRQGGTTDTFGFLQRRQDQGSAGKRKEPPAGGSRWLFGGSMTGFQAGGGYAAMGRDVRSTRRRGNLGPPVLTPLPVIDRVASS